MVSYVIELPFTNGIPSTIVIQTEFLFDNFVIGNKTMFAR